jgi:hypothetical protein
MSSTAPVESTRVLVNRANRTLLRVAIVITAIALSIRAIRKTRSKVSGRFSRIDPHHYNAHLMREKIITDAVWRAVV